MFDRAPFEDVAGGQPQAPAAGGADQLDGRDAVAAEREEALLHADLGQVEDLGEEGGEFLLPVGAGRRAAVGGGEVGGGQRRPVGLVGRGERHLVEEHHRCGHHVVGQAQGRPGDDVGRSRVGSRGGDGVGDEAAHAPVVGVAGDDGPCDAGVGGDPGLDLAGFDAEAPDLQLVVGAARVLQFAALVPAGQVPGAVHPCAGRSVGVGDESVGGDPGAAEVAPGQAGPADVQLAQDPGGDRAQGAVEDVRALVDVRGPIGTGPPVHSAGTSQVAEFTTASVGP